MTWLFCCPDDLRGALSNLDLQSGRRQALAVLASQALLGAIVAIACLAVAGAHAAASAALGAGIGVVATSLMAFAMLKPGDGADLTRVTLGFFSGWIVKVGFTVAVMVMAFRSRKVDAVPLLAAYIATFAGYWVGAARASGQAANKQGLGRSG
jgi:F0F1-type ATP synthase assembly protein I